MPKPVVALIGTLDTKKAEYQHATTWLEHHGCDVVLFDCSTQQPLDGPSDFDLGPDSTLFKPKSLLTTDSKADVPTERAEVREALRRACLRQLSDLRNAGSLDAIASFGGSQNTSFATSIMRDAAFPVGLPKFMLTTMASGDMSSYLGESDICVMPSIGDISGSLNALTLTTLSCALSAINGMAHTHRSAQTSASETANKHGKPMVALTMFGVTTPAVSQISEMLKDQGLEPVAFHATGSGGRSMERLIRQGYFSAVIDLTTTEICDHLYGGTLSAGQERLTAAAESGVPQLVSVGALDMINFGSIESLPAKYELKHGKGPMHETKDGTKIYQHNSQVTLVRTSIEQNKELGKYLVQNLVKGAKKARHEKRGRVRIVFPEAGVSAMDVQDGAWNDPEARQALLASIQDEVDQQGDAVDIDVEVHKHHINSEAFAKVIVERTIALLRM